MPPHAGTLLPPAAAGRQLQQSIFSDAVQRLTDTANDAANTLTGVGDRIAGAQLQLALALA